MAARLKTVATFCAGMAVGAGMVYLAPPAGPMHGTDVLGSAPIGAPGGGGPPPGGPPGGSPPEGGLPGADVVPPPGGGTPGAGPEGEPLNSAADALYPPPPPGAGPPDGGGGPPLEGEAAGSPAAGPDGEVASAQGTGGRKQDWLEIHVRRAETFWNDEARRAEGGGGAAAPFAARMKALAGKVPPVGDRPPPMADVVVLLYGELALYDEMKAAGADVSRIEAELGDVLERR